MRRKLFSFGSIALANMSTKPATGFSRTGVMTILSPAKTLDLTPYAGKLPTSQPDCDLDKTKQVASTMKKHKNLKKLLGVSDKIAAVANSYWNSFEDNDQNNERTKPSIYAFSGAAYQGLDILECSDAAVAYLQENLRIVDPLYGSLRPLDRIQPYRLEMATSNLFKDKIKLADFWKESVSAHLAKDLEGRESQILLNLASDEYSAAVDCALLPESTSYIKVAFKEEGRVIAVHAKRARGLMVRYIAENNVKTLDEVRKFREEGYTFDKVHSDESTIIFDRKKVTTSKKRAASATKVPAKKNKT